MTTSEPPDRPGRPRSDAASRLAALLAEIETSEGRPPAPAPDGPTGADSEARPAAAPTPDPSPTIPIPVVAVDEPAPASDATQAIAVVDLPPPVDEPAPPPAPVVTPNPPVDPLAASEMVTVGTPDPPVVPVAYGRAGLGAGPVGGSGLRKRPPVPDPDALAAADDAEGTAPAGGHAPPVVSGAVLAGVAASAEADAAAAVPVLPAGPAGGRRGPRPWSRLRVVAFGVSVAVLALSVPTLGYAGSRAILHSRSGKLEDERNNPRAPGYSAIVDPTPTALVVQRGPTGEPEALTLLALGNGDSGGSVLFIPLDTVLTHPAIFIDRLRTAYAKAGYHSFVTQVAKLLNEGLGSVIDISDAQWAKVVAPVAPLSIVNPYPVTVGSVTFPAGPLSLAADQVAPYLNALAPGHDDLDRMARHRLVWDAWLKAVAASKSPDAVPASPSSLGPFIETLASGRSQLATLAVSPSAAVAADGANTFQVIPHDMSTQLTDAIPSPVSPGLGDRFSVRLLNGASGVAIPAGVTHRLVFIGAQLNVIGNASHFGQKVTRIEYHDPNRLATAEAVKYVLGGDVSYNPTSTDTVDLVITLGQESLDRVAADPGSAGGTGG